MSVSSSTTSNYGVGSGVSSGPVQSGGGKGLFPMDARKNVPVSTTALVQIPGDSEGGDRVQDDGQLRSGGIGLELESLVGAMRRLDLGVVV